MLTYGNQGLVVSRKNSLTGFHVNNFVNKKAYKRSVKILKQMKLKIEKTLNRFLAAQGVQCSVNTKLPRTNTECSIATYMNLLNVRMNYLSLIINISFLTLYMRQILNY